MWLKAARTEAQQNHKRTLKTTFCVLKNYAVLEQELYRLQWLALGSGKVYIICLVQCLLPKYFQFLAVEFTDEGSSHQKCHMSTP